MAERVPKQVALEKPYVDEERIINYPERRVAAAGRPVKLTVTEYRMLFEISVNTEVVMTRDELLQGDWGLVNSGDLRLVHGVVKRPWDKLGDEASSHRHIFTELGVGYWMPNGES